MTINDLKQNIENKNIDDSLIIFEYKDTDFIAHQYYNEIAKIKNLSISVEENLDDFIYSKSRASLFNTTDNYLHIFKVEKLTLEFKYDLKNTIIVSKSIDKNTKKLYEYEIVTVPKIEEWQIKDYLYSNLQNIDKKLLDKYVYSKSLYKCEVEIERLKYFNSYELNRFITEGLYTELSDTIFYDLINGIVKKDKKQVFDNYVKLNYIDYNPYGFIQLLYNNFRNVILIQLSKSCTSESLDMSSGQFWAIKKNCVGIYSKEQLLLIFDKITSIDRLVKTGKLDTKYIIDYIITYIFSM